jgi:hypothetical protein
VRIGIDSSLALRGGVALLLVGSPETDELFREVAALERMRGYGCFSYTLNWPELVTPTINLILNFSSLVIHLI